MAEEDPESARIPLMEERLVVDKHTVESGHVRVRTVVDEEEAYAVVGLNSTHVMVERVPLDRDVSSVPEARQEGDLLIVPIVEEYLHVEKRLRLKEELRLRLVRGRERFVQAVPVRRMRAVVERDEPGAEPSNPEKIPMRTLTALYDTREDAEAARSRLLSTGVDASAIQITSKEQEASGAPPERERGFLAGLKNFFMADEDRHAYSEGVSRGGYLLTARVPEEQADTMCGILEESGAVDFDARQSQWRAEGWRGPEARAEAAERADETIPVAEERLRVGKREIERGGVRVRSYVEERPVEEQVDLRQERVEIERRPVDEPVRGGAADELFRERTIEATEHAEEPVVSKEAVVREEIGVRKDVEQRTERIADTVRETKVDVQDTRDGGSGEARSFAERSDERLGGASGDAGIDRDAEPMDLSDEERRARDAGESPPDRPRF